MTRAQSAGLVLLLAMLLVVLLMPSMPAIRPFPSRDSGVFLYTGWRVLAGDLPYRDIWDHKPPAILYLNALGLLVGGGSPWGVWLLEFLALGAAALLGYALLTRAFGPVLATFGTAMWLLGLIPILEGGNLTEEYALPCQFLALYAFYRAETRGRYTWHGYAIGLSGVLALLLRPNLVGIWAAIVLYLVLSYGPRRWRSLLHPLATMGAGLIVLALLAIYFAARGGLAEMWDCVFRYNLAYSGASVGSGPVSRLGASIAALSNLSPAGLSITGLAAWFALLMCRLQNGQGLARETRWLDMLLLTLPIELLMVITSGRRYPHYYMAWLPSLAILTTYLFASITASSTVEPRTSNKLLLLSFCLAAALIPAGQLRGYLSDSDEFRKSPPVVAYIERTTQPDDYVLVWGAETSVNFVTRRRSPTRFVYQYPLFTHGYRSAALVQELLRDLQMHQPVLVVDASPTNPEVPSLALEGGRTTAKRAEFLLPEMDQVFAYLAAHYERVPAAEAGGSWPVYRLGERVP